MGKIKKWEIKWKCSDTFHKIKAILCLLWLRKVNTLSFFIIFHSFYPYVMWHIIRKINNNNNNNIVALTKVYCECFKKFLKNTNLINIFLLRVSKNLKDLHDLIYIVYNNLFNNKSLVVHIILVLYDSILQIVKLFL